MHGMGKQLLGRGGRNEAVEFAFVDLDEAGDLSLASEQQHERRVGTEPGCLVRQPQRRQQFIATVDNYDGPQRIVPGR